MRIQRQARARSQTANLLQHGTRFLHRLHVNRDDVRPRLLKAFHIIFRLGDHQMRVQRQIGKTPQRLDNRQPVGQIRYEIAVHHIQVQCLHSRRFQTPNFALQVAKVAEQQRRKHQRRGMT